MYCSQCGCEIAANATICRRCGAKIPKSLPKVNNSPIQRSGRLRVVRNKSLLSGRKTKVFVDKILQGSIEDGDSLLIILEAGEHIIHLQTRIGHKGALFGENRGITESITIKPNTETAVIFRFTPFTWGRHEITKITEDGELVTKE